MSLPFAIARHSHCSFKAATSTLVIIGGQNISDIQTNVIEFIDYKTTIKTFFDNSEDPNSFDSIGLRSNAVCIQTTNLAFIVGGVVRNGSNNTYLPSMYELNLDTMKINPLVANDYSFAHASSSLYKDKIYIFGGIDNNQKINKLRSFDTITRTWKTYPSSTRARSHHASSILSHYLFIFGGETDQGDTNIIDVFDLEESTWLGNLINGERRKNFTAITIEKDILLFGGTSDSLANNSFEKFSLKSKDFGDISGDFLVESNLPITLSEHSSTTLSDGDVLVLGGFENNASILNSSVFRYDSESKIWSTTKDISPPFSRRSHSSNILDQQIYTWGGYLSDGLINNRMSIYDSSIKLWSEGIYGGTSRAQHTGSLNDGKIYFVGGTDDFSDLNSISTVVDIYELDTWSAVDTLSVSLSEHVMNISSDQLYIWAGIAGNVAQNNLTVYDLAKHVEVPGLDGGTIRSGHCGIVYDDKIFYWGGISGSGEINSLDVFDIIETKWKIGNPGGTARQRNDCSSDGKYMYVWGGVRNSLIQNNFQRYTLNPFHTFTTAINAKFGASALEYDSVAYIYGGSSTIMLDSMDTLESISDTFILTSNINASGNQKFHHAGIVKNNKFYYFGGIDENEKFLSSIEIFDPIAKNWDSSKPSAISSLAGATLLDNTNSLLVLGGEFPNRQISNNLLKFDLTLNQWANTNLIESPILSRSFHSSVLVTNTVYVFGGRVTKSDITTFYSDTFQAFSIIDFTNIPVSQSGGEARAYHSSHHHNGSVYIYGGINNDGELVDTVDRYDIFSDTWYLGIDIGDPREFLNVSRGSASFKMNDKFYFYSGYDLANQSINKLISYDPVRWQSLSNGPNAKIDVMGEYHQGKLYYWGGIDSFSNS
ncbi:hypothetical protein MJH12_17750, partial [bacterium]|nr:hypothetical protein [bacterium]